MPPGASSCSTACKALRRIGQVLEHVVEGDDVVGAPVGEVLREEAILDGKPALARDLRVLELGLDAVHVGAAARGRLAGTVPSRIPPPAAARPSSSRCAYSRSRMRSKFARRIASRPSIPVPRARRQVGCQEAAVGSTAPARPCGRIIAAAAQPGRPSRLDRRPRARCSSARRSRSSTCASIAPLVPPPGGNRTTAASAAMRDLPRKRGSAPDCSAECSQTMRRARSPTQTRGSRAERAGRAGAARISHNAAASAEQPREPQVAPDEYAAPCQQGADRRKFHRLAQHVRFHEIAGGERRAP